MNDMSNYGNKRRVKEIGELVDRLVELDSPALLACPVCETMNTKTQGEEGPFSF